MIYRNLYSISQPYSGILLDAYGVFWGGNKKGFLDGAKKAIINHVKQGKVVGILSNTTQLSQNEINKLDEHGLKLGADYHFLLTSGQVAFDLFSKQELPFKTVHKKYFLVGEAHPHFSSHKNLFKNSSFQETKHLQEADFLYISIPHIAGVDQTDISGFEKNLDQLADLNIPAICTNPDLFAHEGLPPKLVVRQGSIAAILEKKGISVFYIGKPAKIMFEKAFQEFMKYGSFNKESIIMVGDTPETDIRGANLFGFASALVTETGIFSEKAKTQNIQTLINNLTTLDTPNFFLKHL